MLNTSGGLRAPSLSPLVPWRGHRAQHRRKSMKAFQRRWRMWRFHRWQKQYLEDRRELFDQTC
jgi:hypothetical protein